LSKLLDGKLVASLRQQNLKLEIEAWNKSKPAAHLVVVLVGNNPASEVYVAQKIKTCAALGILSTKVTLPAEVTQQALNATIQKLALEQNITSILVQLPLPSHIQAQEVLNQIPAHKDPDFLGAAAAADFYLNKTELGPCTPLGVMHLLAHENISVEGLRALVIGRSHLVGLPMSQLLLRKNATVTVAHSKTINLNEMIKDYELVVVAAGKAKMFNASHFNKNAIVIDVGIHRNSDNSICGDVDFKSVFGHVRAVTPVPGGVGPMTICTLMENTFQLHKQSFTLKN